MMPLIFTSMLLVAADKDANLDIKLPPEIVALAKKLDTLLSPEALAAQVDALKVAWLDGARTTGAIGFICGVVVTLLLMRPKTA